MSNLPSHHHKFSDGKPKVLLDTNNQPFIGPVYINGYDFADRKLEGVYFKYTLDADGLGVTVEPKSRDMDYLSDLNLKKFLEQGADFFERTDIVSKNPRGSRDEDDEIALMYLNEADNVAEAASRPAPKQLTAYTASEVMDRILGKSPKP